MSSPSRHDPAPPAPVGGSAAAPGLPAWVWLLALGAGVGIAYLGRSLFLPLLLASIGAYFLNPWILRLQERGVARSKAVLLLFAAFTLILVIAVYLLLPTVRVESQRLVREAPAFAGRIEAALDGIARELRTERPGLAKFLPAEREPGWLLHGIEEKSGEAAALAGHAGAVLFLFILAPMFAFFLLRDGPGLVDWIIRRIHPRHIETSVAVWAEIDSIVGRYLRGLMMESIGVGILAGLGLWFLGIPFPLLLGLFAALVNPLPYIGALMSLGMASLVALAAQLGFAKVGALVVLFAVIRLLDDFVLIPITIGGSVHLHPMLVIVSILVGEHALGVLGMVLAVPTVTVVKEIVRLLLEHRLTLSRRAMPGPVRAVPGHLPV